MTTINIRQPGMAYKRYWKTCVGAGRANEGLRAGFQRHLACIQEHIGFDYLRFHGLLHDDMFVLRQDAQGHQIYNFQYVDELFDMLLDKNIRPFVELGFFPECLRGGDRTQFWWKGHITPPQEWSGWCELVERLVRHWLARYGQEEVRRWYFEVWNEPNLRPFWDGTRSQYFAMYEATVKTIKAVDPFLRVGGPATSNFVPDGRFDGEVEDKSLHMTHKVDDLDSLHWHGVWIKEFLNFCAERKLPVDFVSAHPYPTDFALDETGHTAGRARSVSSTQIDLQWIRNVVDQSAYPDAEIHLTEWSSSPSPRDCTHDYLQEAAYIVKCNLDGVGLVDSLSYWTFTDVFEESGAGNSVFHGGFGLINFQDIVKPGWHAYRMLAALGDTLLYRDEHAFFTADADRVAALLYNYPVRETIRMSPYPDRTPADAELTRGEAVEVAYRLEGLPAGAKFRLEILDRAHGWALPEWQKMGSPEPPTREQAAQLRQHALTLDTRELVAADDGTLSLSMTLEPWSVALLRQLG